LIDVHARAQQIAERLADGRLPRKKSLHMWAGIGKGRTCDGCGESILVKEVEHEHDRGGGTVRFHAACSVLWALMTETEGTG
jgi:hypothetical protein